MTAPSCARKWQVEAARDGRLYGKDLDNALRHRATCAECSHEARELAALREQLSGLPSLARDALSTRRSRQRLMAAWNDSLLQPRSPRPKLRTALIFAFGAATIGACWLVLNRQRTALEPSGNTSSIVDVHAEPGARWSERVDRQLDRVDLADGAASFTVYPHPNRRLVIQLPDGEIEDMGTVFEIRVADGHTQHVAVSEGRVAVRLRGRLEFSLSAGQAWEDPSPASASASAGEPSEAPDAAGMPPSPLPAAVAPQSQRVATSARPQRPHGAARLRNTPDSLQEKAETPRPGEAAPAASAKAEDEAYLHIVELLRQAKPAEARAQAKLYLLRFPAGFRRIEVLNIATRTTDAADDRASP